MPLRAPTALFEYLFAVTMIPPADVGTAEENIRPLTAPYLFCQMILPLVSSFIMKPKCSVVASDHVAPAVM